MSSENPVVLLLVQLLLPSNAFSNYFRYKSLLNIFYLLNKKTTKSNTQPGKTPGIFVLPVQVTLRSHLAHKKRVTKSRSNAYSLRHFRIVYVSYPPTVLTHTNFAVLINTKTIPVCHQYRIKGEWGWGQGQGHGSTLILQHIRETSPTFHLRALVVFGHILLTPLPPKWILWVRR